MREEVVSAARAEELVPQCGELLLEFLLCPMEKRISSGLKCLLFIKLKTNSACGKLEAVQFCVQSRSLVEETILMLGISLYFVPSQSVVTDASAARCDQGLI